MEETWQQYATKVNCDLSTQETVRFTQPESLPLSRSELNLKEDTRDSQMASIILDQVEKVAPKWHN